jgi:flagellar protein FlbD
MKREQELRLDKSCGWESQVIRLTRLNNQLLVVNSDLVKFVENAPDTVLTLITGEKILVREAVDEVIGRILEFRRRVLAGLPNYGTDVSVAAAMANRQAEASPACEVAAPENNQRG